MFSFEFCEILKNIYFTEHIRVNASEFNLATMPCWKQHCTMSETSI